MTATLGLDVGGAYLKAAMVADGRPVDVRQVACPLWLGMDRLDAALAEDAPLAARAERVGVTMTGELSDVFLDRRDGVARLVGRVVEAFGPETRFWMGPRGFGAADEAIRDYAAVASTNFLATAAYVATKTPDALLVDLGSTTTDIIPITDGRPAPRGLTDADRLATGELVYTGLTRTACMAVVAEAPFAGRRQGLCREYFATMADVHRVLGDLPEGVDQHETADRKGKSVAESTARLARMFGRDAGDGDADQWREAARFLADRQMRSIEDGCAQVLSATPLPRAAPMVVAGVGTRHLERLARRLGFAPIHFGALTGAVGDAELWATRCAPAAAVALLVDGS